MNLRNTNTVMTELESIIDDVKNGYEIKKADIRLRGCKHALQIIALAYAFSHKTEGKIIPTKLPHLGVK